MGPFLARIHLVVFLPLRHPKGRCHLIVEAELGPSKGDCGLPDYARPGAEPQFTVQEGLRVDSLGPAACAGPRAAPSSTLAYMLPECCGFLSVWGA